MANEQVTVDPQQRFQEFFKKEKYRQRIAQLAITGKGSITIDFEELYGFDQALAEQLLNRPEEYLQHAGKGAYEQLRIEDAEYAEKIEKINPRIVKLLGKEQLRKLGSRQMAKLIMVEGIVVRATPVRPDGFASSLQMQTLWNHEHGRTNRTIPKSTSHMPSSRLRKRWTIRVCPRRINFYRFPGSSAAGKA